MSSMKLGVVFCSCNDTIHLNFDQLQQTIQDRFNPDTLVFAKTLCLGNEQDNLLKMINEDNYDGILIAACSQNNFQGIFPRKSSLPSEPFLEVVDLREECTPHSSELGFAKATSMIGASLFKLKQMKAPTSIRQEIPVPVAVIGNGFSQGTASFSSNRSGPARGNWRALLDSPLREVALDSTLARVFLWILWSNP